jgi:Protein of unknown function (DUF3192)
MWAREVKSELTRRRHWLWLLLVWLVASGMGCESLLMPSGPSDRAMQAMVDRNNHNLLRLQAGMFEEYVNDIMGPPQRLEGYSWGIVWLYRTAWTREARTTPQSDFTPLVFDRSGVLVGWGRDFFVTYSNAQPPAGGAVRP